MSADLKQLRIVVAAADRGSFTSAATQLNIEVTRVSRAVRDLEQSLGVEIFERLPRGVRLTAAGNVYAASARDILARIAKADQETRIVASGAAGALNLGCAWSFTLMPMIELLGKYAESHPAVVLNLVEDGQESLLARVRSGDLHVALTATDAASPALLKPYDALESMPLWLEPLVVAVPDGEMAQSFTWSDLAGRRLLCRRSDNWRRFVFHVERLGGPPLRFFEQDVSSEGLLALIVAGFGVGIVPASCTIASSMGVRLAPITSDGAALQAEAVWHHRTANPTLTHFLDWSRQWFATVQTDGL